MNFRIRTRNMGVMPAAQVLSRTYLANEARKAKAAADAKAATPLAPVKGMVFEHPAVKFGDLPFWSKVVKIKDDRVTYQRLKDDGSLGLKLTIPTHNFPALVIRVVERPHA